jgi:hypothetical protein
MRLIQKTEKTTLCDGFVNCGGGGDKFPASMPEIYLEVLPAAKLHYRGYSAIHGGKIDNRILL